MKNEFYLQWHITNRCGNRCEHCYQTNYGGEEIDLTDVNFILSSLKECCRELDASPYIIITGGDPFMHKDFFRILEKALGTGARVGIMGNPEPLLADDGISISRLKKLGIDSFQVSLDGMGKTHELKNFLFFAKINI